MNSIGRIYDAVNYTSNIPDVSVAVENAKNAKPPNTWIIDNCIPDTDASMLPVACFSYTGNGATFFFGGNNYVNKTSGQPDVASTIQALCPAWYGNNGTITADGDYPFNTYAPNSTELNTVIAQQQKCIYYNDYVSQQMQQIVTIMISTVFGMGNS